MLQWFLIIKTMAIINVYDVYKGMQIKEHLVND